MATLISNNPLVTNCNVTATGQFQTAVNICAPYIKALQTCPKPPIDISQIQEDRIIIVNETANCLADVFTGDQLPWISAQPQIPEIQTNLTCNYPDFAPILEQACSWDFNRITNFTCGGYGNSTVIYSPDFYEWSLCETEAALQYWRCTQQVPYDQVAQCVIYNSQKVDWLGILKLPYQGASSCSTPAYWIVVQVGSILTSLLGVVISTLLGPHAKKLWNKIRKKTDNKPRKEIWAPPDEYILRASDLLASVGGDLLAIFLSIIVMRQSGVGVSLSTENTLTWNYFLILAIRPRAAPFTGTLGFSKGFAKSGLADIVVDGFLALVAGLYLTVQYFPYIWTPSPNPAAPNQSLKLLGIGAILSVLPPLFWWLAAVLFAARKRNDLSFVAAFFLGIGVMIRIFLVALILPLIALWEILAALYLAVQRLVTSKKDTNSNSEDSTLHYIWQPLDVDGDLFRPSYALLGDLYCPSGSTAISAILILVPIAVKLPMQALGAYIGDDDE
ncbi:hypothetical protein BDZ45DRAFT_754805 [Acephala macrosclerotiorum]|nr:hypothetical protein BDZ45DRAFT_754805 [Acephala macrosclerotiorum]